jgi:hypothetical protein
MRNFRMLIAVLMASFGLMLGITGVSADEGEGEDGGYTCSGGSFTTSPPSPSIIPAGNYKSITVTGQCLILTGTVNVQKSLTIAKGAALITNLSGVPGIPDDATVNVGRNVNVERGATLLFGCNIASFGCTVNTTDTVGGNFTADGALGVVVHSVSFRGNFSIEGGGGKDYACSGVGAFAAFGSPTYSTLEDSRVSGNVSVTDYKSCWLGLARTTIGGNARYSENVLGDPDAIEIVSNTINGNLSCHENQVVDTSTTPFTFTDKAPWDSVETGPNIELNRQSLPNTVNGKRSGQCVNANPPPGLF